MAKKIIIIKCIKGTIFNNQLLKMMCIRDILSQFFTCIIVLKLNICISGDYIKYNLQVFSWYKIYIIMMLLQTLSITDIAACVIFCII